MISTRFTELVGCTVPIQQAGMGAVAAAEAGADLLVAQGIEAGGYVNQ